MSPFHKGIQTFVSCKSKPSSNGFVHLVARGRFGLAHAPLFFTKMFKHSRLMCVSSSHVFVRLVTRG